MVTVIRVLSVVLLAVLSTLSLGAEFDIVRGGYYRLSIDGVIQETQRIGENTIQEDAINALIACPDCVVEVISPVFRYTLKGFSTEPLDCPEPPPVIICPEIPPIEPCPDCPPVVVCPEIPPPVVCPEPEVCPDCPIVVIPPIDPPVDPPIDPTVEPPVVETPVAMYSYRADKVDAHPLEGAELLRQPVYIWWTGEWANAISYCCKTAGEAHRSSVPGLLFALDPMTYPNAGVRELYVDLVAADGTMRNNNIANFTLEDGTDIIAPPVEPPIVPGDGKGLTLQWTAPEAREDETPLNVDQLSGYSIHYWNDDDPRSDVFRFVQPGTTLEYDVEPALEAGRLWHFRVNAQDRTPSEACPDTTDWTDEQIKAIAYTCGGPLVSKWSATIDVQL